jgi:hypothetical protein
VSIVELEQAISRLPAEDLSKFTEWFEDYLAEQWDRQIERDLTAGKLDHLIRKTGEDIDAGRFTPL